MVLGLEPLERPLEVAGLGAHRPRHPVDRAQLVEDRAFDSADRVGLELVAAVEVELFDCVDETEDPVAHEIGLIDTLRQAYRHPTGDVLHEWRVLQDETVTYLALAVGFEAGPQVVERSARVRAHARGWAWS